MKIYIENFVDDLNYQKIILWIGNVNKKNLYDRLVKDQVNHMYRFTSVVQDNYMYIENCDLQDLSFEILDYLEEGYSVYPLFADDKGYYIEVDSFVEIEIRKGE